MAQSNQGGHVEHGKTLTKFVNTDVATDTEQGVVQ